MTTFDTVYCIVVLSAFAITASIFYYEKKFNAPPIPTLPWVKKAMIDGLKKYLDPQGSHDIRELGCGWGGVVFGIGKAFRTSKVIGYEISPAPFWWAKMRRLLSFRCRHVKIYNRDFMKEDLRTTNALLLYLSPQNMSDLKPKLESELPKGAIIISNGFPMKGWTAIETLKTNVFMEIPIHVYRIG